MSSRSGPAQISVVVATHNGAKFLREQLKSLENQTLAPHEIIVSDDHSADGTVEIAEEFARKSPIPYRIIENVPALGFRSNFLRAAKAATGDLIAFCDQDDIWDERKLALCLQHAADPAVALIAHTAVSVDRGDQELGLFAQGIRQSGVKPPLSYDPWSTFFGFSMVFRRELLDLWDIEDRFVDFIVPSETIAHDRWIMFLSQMVGNTVEIDIPLVRYRQHGNNLFGDGARGLLSAPSVGDPRLDAYRAATAKMIAIVENLPAWTGATFPLFDRERSLEFLRRALHQLEQRDAVYRSPTRGEALKRISSSFKAGTYRAVHNGRIRWRSIAKDVTVGVIRR